MAALWEMFDVVRISPFPTQFHLSHFSIAPVDRIQLITLYTPPFFSSGTTSCIRRGSDCAWWHSQSPTCISVHLLSVIVVTRLRTFVFSLTVCVNLGSSTDIFTSAVLRVGSLGGDGCNRSETYGLL